MAARRCSTPGCRRAPRPNHGICDPCVPMVLFGGPAPRALVARLSQTDPMALAISAELAARSGR